MKKLALNLDDLQVDSFEPQPRPRGGGTVLANESEAASWCIGCFTYLNTDCAGCGSGGGVSGCDTHDACCQANTEGGRTCDTTCAQIICGCSAFPTDCDATCPNYANSPGMSCGC
jgi:hypothetical protein